MKAYSLQINLKLGDVENNLKKIEKYLFNISNNSIFVLPEMFSSGFDNENLDKHTKKTPTILRWLEKVSNEKRLTIVGTLPEKVKGKIFNRAFIVDNGKIIYKQSKIKLFRPTGEDKYFHSGKRLKVVETSKGKIGILICFELRFPDLVYKLRKNNVEILVVPAEWGKSRKKHFEILSRARAIEEQTFVITSDVTGQIGDIEMAGSSGIYSPWGDIIDFEDEKERLLEGILDLKEVYKVRRAIKMYD
ncbi:MAG: nitrilase [Persephonella sp.]|nr:MAG: nitrilase [Persephonella sp.]